MSTTTTTLRSPYQQTDTPLYATIACGGGYYSVVMRGGLNSTCHMAGYDKDRLLGPLQGSGVPLIDFRTGDTALAIKGVLAVREALCDEHRGGLEDWEHSYYPTLQQFVQKCIDAGCTVSTL